MDDILQTALRDAGLDFFDEPEPTNDASSSHEVANGPVACAPAVLQGVPDVVHDAEEAKLEPVSVVKPAVARRLEPELVQVDTQLADKPMVRIAPVTVSPPASNPITMTSADKKPAMSLSSPMPGDQYPASAASPTMVVSTVQTRTTVQIQPVERPKTVTSIVQPQTRPISAYQIRKTSIGQSGQVMRTIVPRKVVEPASAVGTIRSTVAQPTRTFRQIRTVTPNGPVVVQRIPVTTAHPRPINAQPRTTTTVMVANDGTRTVRTYSYAPPRRPGVQPAGSRYLTSNVYQTTAPAMLAQQGHQTRPIPTRQLSAPGSSAEPPAQVRIIRQPMRSGAPAYAADPLRPGQPHVVKPLAPLPKLMPRPAPHQQHHHHPQQLPGPSHQRPLPLNAAKTPLQQTNRPASFGRDAKPDQKDMNFNALAIEEEEEKHMQVDTFIEYKPLKLRSGCEHPDSVVETASLSAVSAPEIRYHMTVPEEVVDSGKISALQLEAALYACQTHERVLPSGERMGYLIGDGAGVGKGRTIATIIFENYLLGRKRALWFSVSSDLYYDAVRDLRDIGADNIEVHQLNTMRYAKLNSAENGFVRKGVVFATYSSLICEARQPREPGDAGGKEGRQRITSRLQQLVQWCGEGFDGPIIFDECHHAKNLVPSAGSKPTKTGRYVLELQRSLPEARVVYASATGATEPRNMAYMTRLGLWGERQVFPTFSDFIHAVEDRGVGAMEMVAMDMKLRGLYLARQLSFKGVSFSVEEVQLDDDFVKLYDESVKLWMECRRQFQYAIDLLKQDERNERTVWAQFWSAHQRFFKYLCIGAKVNACVAITRQALADGKCVVIGLQSTGEAQTLGVLGDAGEITDFVSTTKAVLQNLIEKHFPTGDSDGFDVLGDIGRMFSVGGGGGGGALPMSGEFSRKRRYPVSIDNIQPALKFRRRNNSAGSANEDEKSSNAETEELEEAEDSNSEADSDAERSSDEEDDEEEEESDDLDDDDDDEPEEEEDEDQTRDDDTDDEHRKFGKREKHDSLFDTLMDELDDAYVPDVDPFHHDFSSAEDPWAHLQRFPDDQNEAEERQRRKEKEEKQRRKAERKRKRRLRLKRRRRREKKEAEERKRKEREVAEQRRAQNATSAADFMKSTKVIDNHNHRDASSLLMIKTELLAAVERLGHLLPPNTLDQLIDDLGGPDAVAEMTGRRGRIVVQPSGQAEYQLRNANSMAPVEQMNLEEKEKFMSGEKLVAVISEAASSGISLQSDRRVANKKRRVHITLELPWSADKAVQQFGRTHRSNQLSAPEYLFLISELAGEKRFASTVAKRLECLGALTHGDRRAAESRDLSQFNLDNRYGREALQVMIKTLANPRFTPLLPAPANYKVQGANFFDDMREYLVGVGVLSRNENNPAGVLTIEKEGVSLSKFLNRLLGLPVHAQNALFGYFTDIINELIRKAKQNGTFDKGIMDLGGGTDKARKMEHRVFRGVIDNSNFVVEMHKIGAERGIKWEDATKMFEAQTDDAEDACGFYISKPLPGRKPLIILLIHNPKRSGLGPNGLRTYITVRPNTGRSVKAIPQADVTKRFTRLPMVEAEKYWKDQYEQMGSMCLHRYMINKCRTEEQNVFCEVGRRFRTYFVLTGSVISIWPVLERALNEARARPAGQSALMQTVRIQTDDGQKLVGLLVMPQNVKTLLAALHELGQK